MSTFIFNDSKDKILKIYTNLCRKVFESAGELVYDKIRGNYGILYDDYDYDKAILEEWKKMMNLDKIFKVCLRKKTLQIDDKVKFDNVTRNSKYTPDSFANISLINDTEGLYYVKKRTSSCGRGVNVYNYDSIKKVEIKDSVIQKDVNVPDLYQGKRYKIRHMVLLHNKKMYSFKRSFFTISNKLYKKNDTEHEMHVISQRKGIKFELSERLENYEKINENIILSLKDLKNYYKKEILDIEEDEFVLLGFDYVVDNCKNVYIIEINHRPNYKHPDNVNTIVDINCVRDTILLMINNSEDNTEFELI